MFYIEISVFPHATSYSVNSQATIHTVYKVCEAGLDIMTTDLFETAWWPYAGKELSLVLFCSMPF